MSKKNQKTETAPLRNPLEFPEFFLWKGKKYYPNDVFILCLPQVGMMQEIKLLGFYCYGADFCNTMLRFNLEWCSIAVNVENEKTWRNKEVEISMQWWQNDWHHCMEDGMFGLGKPKDNPFRQRNCPDRIRNIKLQLDGYVFLPVSNQLILTPSPIEVEKENIVPLVIEPPRLNQAQLTLF